MKTIEQLTGTQDLKTNLVCFVLLSTIIILITSFVLLASINGIKSF